MNAATRPLDSAAMVKEAGFSALVVFGLAIAMVGFEAKDVTGGMEIVARFGAVGAATALTFLGRMALILIREGRPAPVALIAGVFAVALGGQMAMGEAFLVPFASPVMNWVVAALAALFAGRALWDMGRDRPAGRAAADAALRSRGTARHAGWMLLGCAMVLPFAPFADRQVMDVAILVATYVMLGWGLNIVVGLAGLLDLGYVAFYAVGAYSFALLSQYFEVGFWFCLPFAGVMAAFAGILLGFPVLRLRGDYLAIVTLGFGEMIRVVLLNWYQFTNGPDGISGIPRPTLFGLEFKRRASEGGETFHGFFGLDYAPTDRMVFLYYLILAMAMVTNLFTLRIRRLPVGRAWEALREDEIACRSLGINPTNTKLTAFAIGAMFAGFAGSFFATRQGFISPESFTFIESAVILAIVVLGGMGSQIGVVLAAIILIGLPEFFRELQQYRMLAFGLAMVLVMVWRPSGLVSRRDPTIRLEEGER